MKHRVLVVMGSENDRNAMAPATEVLRALGVEAELRVASAHRTPDRAAALASEARARGVGVIIAGAGLAHHLAGALAARTTLPVVAVPIVAGPLAGLDALVSAVQMPPGVPVAVVGLGAAKNAGLLAAAILAVGDEELAGRLDELRREQARAVEAADERTGGTVGKDA